MPLVAKHDWPVGEYPGLVVTKHPKSVYVDGGQWGTYCNLPDELLHPSPPSPGLYVATLALREDGKGSRVVSLRDGQGAVLPLSHVIVRGNFEEISYASDPAPRVEIGDPTKLPVLILKASRLYTDSTLTRMLPNYGEAFLFTWDALAKFLSDFKMGDLQRYPDPNIAKRQWGGWVGGQFKDNHRIGQAFISTRLLIVDVDGNADIERLIALLRRYRIMVHTSFKSTGINPRVRLIFMLARPCTDPTMYKVAHARVRAFLTTKGFVLDDGASDCSRLNYSPMHRPGYTPRFHMQDGELLDIDQIVQPVVDTPPRAAPVRTTRSTCERDEPYRQAALRKAHDNLAAAVEGTRHDTLIKEAWCLSRRELDLTIEDIESALMPAYQHDIQDGKRAIRDEFRARRRRTS